MFRLMRILVLQLKRIGDLVLTAPALAALRDRVLNAQITLAVAEGSADLAPAFPMIDRALGSNALALWSEVSFSRYDAVLDFTGTDRSAALTLLSKAPRRLGFAWMKKARFRSMVYNEFIDSPARDHHTTDHYLHLVDGFAPALAAPRLAPSLILPAAATAAVGELVGSNEFALIHPGSARPEKYWVPAQWAKVIAHLHERHGLECVISGGSDPFEKAHIAEIQAVLSRRCLDLSGKIDLLTFAAVIARTRLCVSCDTAAVHLAGAFRRPQIALYGPTNPFHWRPRHVDAVVLSAAQPDAPMTAFEPKMKGAPMDAIGVELVLAAADGLLAPDARPI